MAWSVPVNVLDVFECTVSYVCLDQLIQYRFDVVITGAGGPFTTDQLMEGIRTEWFGFGIPALLSDKTFHVQTRVQLITNCLLIGGKPRRIRGSLDKVGADANYHGTKVPPHLPLVSTVSAQLITMGNPRQFWGKKGFGQLPADVITGDGEKLNAVQLAAWDNAVSGFFMGAHPIPVTTGLFTCGILPTTFVANQPLPHGGMQTYFLPIIGVQIGQFLGTQNTRDIEPQALLGH